MKKDYSLLLFGIFSSVYIINLVKNLKRVNPQINIYYWGLENSNKDITDIEYLNCFTDYCLYKQELKFTKYPVLRTIESIIKFRKEFKKFAESKHFDIVNIHYTQFIYVFILDLIKRCSSMMVLSPWGKDVRCSNKKESILLRILYNSANYVTGDEESEFTKMCLQKFKFSPRKLYSHVWFGSEIVDYTLENKTIIDTKEAKKRLGLTESYVITCGYNADPDIQHLSFIEAVNKAKNELPSNLLLLFPLTYGGTLEYRKELKNKVKEYNLRAVYYEDFLEVSQLFLVRQATDMYIHILKGDAGGASLKEYLLCDKKTIIGGWLRYSDLGKGGPNPYFISDKIEDLDKTIVKVYHSQPIKYSSSTEEILSKKGWKTAIRTWDEFYSKIV